MENQNDTLILQTCNSAYLIKDTNDPRFKTLSGGNYSGQLINTPMEKPVVGEPFQITFAEKNVRNQTECVPGLNIPLAGATIMTSPIQQIYDLHVPAQEKPEKQAYNVMTRDGSIYTIKDTDNPAIQTITGGTVNKLDENEIWANHPPIEEGQRLSVTFANSQKNDIAGYTGQTMSTSPVMQIQRVRETDAAMYEMSNNITNNMYSTDSNYDY